VYVIEERDSSKPDVLSTDSTKLKFSKSLSLTVRRVNSVATSH